MRLKQGVKYLCNHPSVKFIVPAEINEDAEPARRAVKALVFYNDGTTYFDCYDIEGNYHLANQPLMNITQEHPVKNLKEYTK